MPIPKRIHFGLFGGHQLSDLNRRCMATWKAVLPDYEVVAWSDANIPMNKWVRRAMVECPINCHNYMQLWAIWKHGGVAMDGDVEMIRPFDLNHGMMVGFQKDDELLDCVNNAVIGCEPGHPSIRRILDRIELRRPTDDPVWIGCGLLTGEMHHLGMREPGKEVKIGDVMIYGKDRFSPWFHDEIPDRVKITERTFAVHLYEGSWGKKKTP